MSARGSKRNSETDWVRVDALEDSDIDTSEVQELGEEFFSRARVRLPGGRVAVTVRLTPEVADWYRKLGADAEERMVAALRIYAEAHGAGATAD